MIDLRHRSYEKELMDRPDIPFADMAVTLKELNVVNSRLGGHRITLKAIRQLAGDKAQLHVCEIGCGGGDNLAAIFKYCAKRNVDVRFTGIDLNKECIAYARQQYPELPCRWICSDYEKIEMIDDRPDVVFNSLFCHHFNDGELVPMLEWLKRNSTLGFFINDLHRHWLAFYLIKYITRYFSKSYLVKNDASLSVARSFLRSDWQRLFRQAGLGIDSIRWQWAFRWLVIYKHH